MTGEPLTRVDLDAINTEAGRLRALLNEAGEIARTLETTYGHRTFPGNGRMVRFAIPSHGVIEGIAEDRYELLLVDDEGAPTAECPTLDMLDRSVAGAICAIDGHDWRESGPTNYYADGKRHEHCRRCHTSRLTDLNGAEITAPEPERAGAML